MPQLLNAFAIEVTLASDLAEAYIGVSSFRAALRKRMQAVRRANRREENAADLAISLYYDPVVNRVVACAAAIRQCGPDERPAAEGSQAARQLRRRDRIPETIARHGVRGS